MLKYIGAGVALLGLIMLVAALLSGKRNGIRQSKEELAMITGAGYASDHVAEKKERSPFEQQFATRIKKRRRQLDEESQSIFELVEKERAEKNQAYIKQQPKIQKIRKGTDVLPVVSKEAQDTGKGTDILEAAPSVKKGTDVLHATSEKKGTDILMPSPDAFIPRPERRGTDVLPDSAAKIRKEKPVSPKGTDILREPSKKGTDILLGNMMMEEETADPPKKRKGTDVLPSAGKGTDVLTLPKKGTDVLAQPDRKASPARKRTDVLPDREIPKQAKKGTDVLPDYEISETPRKGTDIL